jgi:hypothetical protein
VDLGQVDTDDGAQIVRNVFRDNEDQIVNTLGGQGGGGFGDVLGGLLGGKR